MKKEKQIEIRLREYKERKAGLTRQFATSEIRNLNRKIEELEWVLEKNG